MTTWRCCRIAARSEEPAALQHRMAACVWRVHVERMCWNAPIVGIGSCLDIADLQVLLRQ